ncbi:glycosyltransferase family 61 protein [Aeromonas veronii]|uniref:glycosyltransferase family 61 protein n=1 Tax=Aeromonas veronii TaxID=654 RepID=UPI003B9EF4D5
MIERLFKKKKRVLIFGAGAGGINFFKKNRHNFKIIGFLDNNIKKHGTQLLRHPIYAPAQLGELNFDKVIIASDYYKSIYEQLINEKGVASEKIEIFFYNKFNGRNFLQKSYDFIEVVILELACKNDSFLSYLSFRLFHFISGEPLHRLPIDWLDKLEGNKVHTFRSAESSVVYGPRFLNRTSSVESITLPEVALYRFRNAEVKSVSRCIYLPNNRRVVLERVPTAETKYADYRSSRVTYHGNAYALIRDEKSNRIAKGVLVNGFSDTNYYHLMLEVLSQIQFVKELPEEFSDFPILLSEQCQSISSIRHFLEYNLPDRNVVFLNSTDNYVVDDLLYINMPNALVPNLKLNAKSNVKNSYVRLESLNYLRNLAYAMSAKEMKSPSPKRIFLGRKPGLRTFNQDEIILALSNYDFTCVYLEDLNFNQQVTIMANAEIIVGPTGAAWTNLIFANRKAQALCWMAEEAGDLSCFSNLAAAFNINMQYITYVAGSNDTRELYSRSYYMPVENIIDWVNSVTIKAVGGQHEN